MKWTNRGHQLDHVKSIYGEKTKIYIYGAGIYGADLYHRINWLGNIDGFIDRNVEKQQNGYLGEQVIAPEKILQKVDEEHIIIVAMEKKAAEQVMRLLRTAGYIKALDCFYIEDFLDFYTYQQYAFFVADKLMISSVCMIPSTVCNLKCKDCLNFSPYFKKHIIHDFTFVKRDIDTLFRWIDYTPRFQVSGGEPLLNKDLGRTLVYLDENYRNRIESIETVINGSIVPGDELCRLMKEHRIKVYLDDYRENVPQLRETYKQTVEKLEKYGIEWIDNYVPEWFSLDVEHTEHSDMTDLQLENYFDNCGSPWNCLENERLYSCNFAHFAAKAGIIEETENDYFDLKDYSEVRKTELLEFLLKYTTKGYVDFCKKCAGWSEANCNKVKVAEQIE